MMRRKESQEPQNMGRRQALKTIGKLATAGTGLAYGPWVHAAPTFKIGYVSPQTGPLAVFAEPDAFVLGQLRQHFAGGLKAGGKIYGVEILVKDSQSNASRAAEVTNDLIMNG